MTAPERSALAPPDSPLRWLGLPAVLFRVPEAEGEPPVSPARRNLLAGLMFTGGLSILLWAIAYALLGQPQAAALEVAYALVTAATFVWYRLTGRAFRGVLLFHMVLVELMPFLITALLGGFVRSGAFSLWALLGPMAALVFTRPRHAWGWLLAFVVLLAGAVALDAGPPPAELLSSRQAAVMVVFNTAGVTLHAIGLLYYFLQALVREQVRSELLLLNVLPREIAERLKREPGPQADHFDAATILFADVQGFTRLASKLTPMQVVETLNQLYSAFDAIVARYGLEKIKTIGDCYMIAAGVPAPRPDHAEVLVRVALDMLECVRVRQFAGNRIRIRIGVHSGPVAAGVIGQRRFVYDLWGDSVNVASRIEERALPDQVLVSASTWALVSEHFEGQPVGTFELTAGEVEVWRVLGARPPTR